MLWSEARMSSPEYKPVQSDMENQLLPLQQLPPLHTADRSKGMVRPIQFGTRRITGVARRMLKPASICLRHSNSWFFLRVYCQNRLHEWVCTQGSTDLTSELSFSLGCYQPRLMGPICQKLLVLGATYPPFTHSSVSKNSSASRRPGAGLGCQRLFESHTSGTFHEQ